MSSLLKARVALEDLEKLVNINVSSKKVFKDGSNL